MRAPLPILLATVASAACATRQPPPPEPAPRSGGLPASLRTVGAVMVEPRSRPGKPVTERSLAAVGLDPAALDLTVDPCDDFYQFACGGWIKRTEIAADQPEARRCVVDIENQNLLYEHAMLEQARTRPGNDATARQLGAFYGSCMDEAAIGHAGLAPIRPLLAMIDRIKDARSLTTALAAIDAAGFAGLFTVSPVQDAADARNVIAGIDQGGLGLPDRDYYLSGDDPTRSVLTAYQAYIEGVLAALGHKLAGQEAADVVALETEIARISRDKLARRDPRASYHKIDRAGVARAMPRLDWDAFWAGIGLRDVQGVTVGSPDLLAGLDRVLGSTRPEVWRAYLAFHVADQAAPLLTRPLEDLQFKFTSALTGQPEQSPRWKRCVAQTVDALGDLVGPAFARDRFGPAARAAAEDQVFAVVTAMMADLDALPWMDDATRARARDKLYAMTYQIGYPDRWRSYPLTLDPKAWAANALAARRAERARQLARIEKPVDRSDWQIAAPEVDADYDPQLNRLLFPAGILQPPLYSLRAAIPVNLGGIGVVVGHALTHGFDAQGARYDATGNLATAWPPATEQQFRQRAQCVIDQYGGYEIGGGGRLDGAATADENIADIGGVKLAFAAYRQLRGAASDTVIADGFTEDQQFFVGFGQAWCAKARPDYERMLAMVAVHAPPRWRVNGALSATPEFARAFRCKTGSKMVPAKQCVIW
ncbi:MAG TPA: M13 family metallopeptidase [Kofleriaceae bacterium]|nr:M13 family metallopeptidase [Kofleriaceae bacterium]